VRKALGRISEWSVTNPSPAIAAVIAIVAIIGIVGALRLTPDAGTDKLVDNGSAAFEGTEQFRERFGDDAIVVLAKGDLQRLVLTEDLGQLQKLENCLSGAEPPPGTTYAVEVCERIAALDATRVVFGPATFLTTAATETSAQIQSQIQSVQAESQAAAEAAIARAARQGYSDEQQQQFGEAAAAAVEAEAFADYQDLATRVGDIRALLDPGSQQFVQSIVFDLRQASGTPKSRFGYLFPSEEGALISIRLEPGLDDETRREAIGLIR
jgi:predicted RND superfamily exporter protein